MILNQKVGISRDYKLDALKGFLIMCVVYGHLTIPSNLSPIFSYIHGIIYYFHMPLFLAVSTLFVHEFSKAWVERRIKSIIIPFVFWVVYYCVVFTPSNPLGTLRNSIIPIVKMILWGNWIHLQSILWFLPALFSSLLVWNLYKNKVNDVFTKTIFWSIYVIYFININTVAIHYHVYIPYSLDLAVYLVPLFACANFVYKEHSNNRILKEVGLLGASALIFLSIHGITVFEHVKTFTEYHYRIDLAQLTVPLTIIGYLSMIFLSCSILLLFLRLPKFKWLSYIGRYSFFIFVLHLFFVKTFSIRHVSDNLNFNCLLEVILNLSTCVIVPIIISKVLMKNWFRYIGAVE